MKGLLLLALLLLPASASGEEEGPLLLSLSEAVRLSLEQNLDIRIEREVVAARRAEIILEAARFDPSLFFEAKSSQNVEKSTRVENFLIPGAEPSTRVSSRAEEVDIGVKNRLTTGGDLSLTFANNRSSGTFQTLNPTLKSRLFFELKQPLLKNFGPEIARAPLRVAKNSFSASGAAFIRRAEERVLAAIEGYWNLLFAREDLSVQRRLLRAAEELLAMTKSKVDLGVMAPIETLVAESGLASRKENVVLAEERLAAAEENLALLLQLSSRIVPTDSPTDKAEAPRREAAIEEALEKREDLKAARLEERNREIALSVARNHLLPSLDFSGKAGVNGVGPTYPEDLRSLSAEDLYIWEAGVVLTFPLGNRSARSTLARDEAERRRARLIRERIEQEIRVEVSQALRAVETGQARIGLTRTATLLAEKKLEAGTERFRLGLISGHDLLDFQNDAADARRRDLKALTDYNVSLARLSRATGTLVTEDQIVLPP